jgi:endoribonuclease LACTB2
MTSAGQRGTGERMWDWDNPPFAIRRVEVANTGFMLGQPTNCYILGRDTVVIVDPGSEPGVEDIPAALETRGNPTVQAIYLTHAHPDHATAAAELRTKLGAPVMLHPGNKPIADLYFSWEHVDIEIDPAEPLQVEGLEFEIVMTSGHAPGHAALFHRDSRVLIAGDLVSGNGTIGVFPPHGNMKEYIDSLYRARALNPSVLLPGHGPAIDDPEALFKHYLERRLGRERQIYELVAGGKRAIPEIIPELYPDLDPQNTFPAESTILAHLLKLAADGKLRGPEDDPRKGTWTVADSPE